MTKNSRLIHKIVKYSSFLSIFMPKILLNCIWLVLDSSESKIALLFRLVYLKKYCKKVSGIVYVGKNTNLKNLKNLSLGSNVSLHSFVYLDAYGGIEIGDNVSIANHCTIISSDHTWEDSKTPIKYNEIVAKPINIKSDVWIAAGCRILGDVTIETRTIVGAGAVVTKNLEQNSLYVGIPAKRVKPLH